METAYPLTAATSESRAGAETASALPKGVQETSARVLAQKARTASTGSVAQGNVVSAGQPLDVEKKTNLNIKFQIMIAPTTSTNRTCSTQ